MIPNMIKLFQYTALSTYALLLLAALIHASLVFTNSLHTHTQQTFV